MYLSCCEVIGKKLRVGFAIGQMTVWLAHGFVG